MSPAVARTSRPEILAAGRALLEEGGIDAVTMATVAARVGVRPPSLYKHVRDRGALLVALASDAADELGRTLAALDVKDGGPAEARIVALGDAYRAFARRHPRAAAMLFAHFGGDVQPAVDVAAVAARPVVDAAAALVGPERALAGARVLTAFAYGFTTMEAAGAFRFGGDVDEAYRLGITAIARGLAGDAA